MDSRAFTESEFPLQTATRLREAFERSRNPMLIADDQRRWVTGNDAAADLLGISRDEVPWRTMDEFTPPTARRRLEKQWEAFLTSGAAEGWYELYVPDRGPVSVEFSATANVLPARHLSVFIPPDSTSTERSQCGGSAAWKPVVEESGRLELTNREREIMTLVASGLHSEEMAEQLFLSPETVKTHVQHAMAKLGVHTRAHAVAIALVTGQITWEIKDASASAPTPDDPPSAG
jgi:PAS domain S-box-containing protein